MRILAEKKIGLDKAICGSILVRLTDVGLQRCTGERKWKPTKHDPQAAAAQSGKLRAQDCGKYRRLRGAAFTSLDVAATKRKKTVNLPVAISVARRW